MALCTWDGGTSTDWDTAANWATSGAATRVPTADDDVIIPDTSSTNNPTLAQSSTINSLTIQASGTIVGGGYTLTIDNEGTSGSGTEGYAANIDGHVSGELNLVSTKDGTTFLDLVCQSGNVHDLTIASSGGDYKILVGNTTLTGTLWIKDGNLKMNGDSDTLSVTEDIKLGDGSDAGFFGHDDHDGAIDARSLAIITAGSTFTSTEGVLTLDGENASGFAFDNDGVFVHNSGTVTITTAATTSLDTVGASGNQFHHLTINHASCNAHYSGNTTVAGNLTITAGELTCSNAAGNFTVTGATSITGTLTCGDAAITLGNNVDDAYSVVVNSSGTFTGGSGTHILGAINVNSSATNFTFSSGNTTITGRATSGNSRRVLSTSATDRITAAGTLIIDQARTPLSIRCDDTTGINNLTMNCGTGRVLHIDNDLTVGGILNVSAGTVNTRNVGDSVDNDLTVTGATIVGDGSSGANTATLTCNASTVSLGASVTSGWGLEVKQGGTFVGGSGAHTIGSLLNADHAHSIITLTSHASGTTLSSENAGVGSNGYALILYDDGVFDDADGLVVFTGPSSDSYVSGHNLHDVTINSSGNSIALQNGQTFAGNLTITAGTLTTRPAGTTENNALTVNGDCVVTGTLTLNDSTVAVGALRAVSGAAITQGSSGTLEITTGSNFGGSSSYSFKNEDGTSDINLGGTLTQSAGTYFDPRTAPTYASVLNNVVGGAAAYWIGKVTIGGTFTVNAGDKWQTYGGSDSFIVTGNVTLNGTLQATTGYLAAGSTGEMKFGSLTIASGGKYSATPLTTTITAETSSHAWNNTGGTFTHNNGKVKIYDATGSVMGSTSVRENTFYDLEISLYATTYTCSLYDVSGNAVTILNNLDVTKGEVEFSTASDTITIHGLTNITANAKFCDNASHNTNKIIHNGLVTNLGTYNINDGTTVKLNGGIRQLGTLTVK